MSARRLARLARTSWIVGSLALLVAACADDGWGWLQVVAVIANVTSALMLLDAHERRFDRRQRSPRR